MGKTRDLFKKIRDTKGTFHAKMGTIKERNGMDLTEGEDIKRRYTEYTESEVAQSYPTLCDPMNRSTPGLPLHQQLLHKISVLYCAHLCVKCSLDISNLLEELSSLSHSIVFLYFFALISEEGFLFSPCY